KVNCWDNFVFNTTTCAWENKGIQSIAPSISSVIQPTCSITTGTIVLNDLPSGNWIINPGNITGNTVSTTIAGLISGTTYQFNVTNEVGCVSLDTQPILIQNSICANTETTPKINGLTGGTTSPLTSNDTLNGVQVVIGNNSGQVSLTGVTVPTGLILNPDGTVTVQPSTPAGNYNVTYTICEVVNSTNCDTVTSIVVVGAAEIIAKNDIITVDNTFNAVIITPFNRDHGNGVDTLNGLPVTLDLITVTVTDIVLPNGQSYPVPKVDTVTNEIVIPASVPAGFYSINYTICEKLNPNNCSDATITITVNNPVILATDDTFPTINGNIGSSNIGNVLFKNPNTVDSINGIDANINLVNIKLIAPAIPKSNGALIPFLNTATGDVEVPSNTPAGTYTITYSICDKINPTVCDEAIATINVVTIDAVDDGLYEVISLTGKTINSVLLNDSFNGVILSPSTYNTIVLKPIILPNGFTLKSDGTIDVAAGVPVGIYTITYEICTKNSPTLCDQAIVKIKVENLPAPAPPVVFADDDNLGGIDGSNGTKNVISILSNDFIDLTPATINNVNINIITPDATGSLILN
ncbi:hypothetical protein ACSVH7_15105, partial [Flavobacterium sp. TSSA_36]